MHFHLLCSIVHMGFAGTVSQSEVETTQVGLVLGWCVGQKLSRVN
jgi:hypothetical protein